MQRKTSQTGQTLPNDPHDNAPTICRATHNDVAIPATLARLTIEPPWRLSFNRCNLPAEALASFAFQLAPQSLELDGVAPLHRRLFEHAGALDSPQARVERFLTYMNAHFLLDDPPAQGLSENARIDRSRLDYLRLLRGWLFDADSREGAVLKAWVESRFGLLTRYHRALVGPPGSPSRTAFDHEVASGLYTTGALEAQIDLLYTWTQHELRYRYPGQTHLHLYRGVSGTHWIRGAPALADGRQLLTLNNLSSFSASPERADEFGDRVLGCAIPLPKILAFSGLLPGLLQGEDEYLVIGGVVAAERVA